MSATPAPASTWVVETRRGDAATLHGTWPSPADARTRRVAVCHVTGPPALVLGSGQGRFGTAPGSVSDLAAGSAPGSASGSAPGSASGSAQGLPPVPGGDAALLDGGRLAVVRRRGGGGAVLVEPGGQVWIDVWVPRGDPLWEDDVVVAARWLGEAWAAALAATGMVQLAVHGGRSVAAPWSDAVCFAGAGPGEVLAGNPPRKVVGLTQHRSRDGARLATMACTRWQPAALVGALAAAGLVSPAAAGEVVRSVAGRAAGILDLDGAGPLPARGGAIVQAVEAAAVRAITSR